MADTQSALKKDIRTIRTDMPRLCVVTPTFNSVKFIDDTILGVVSQRGHFLLCYHVRDGGSTDGTVGTSPFSLPRWQYRETYSGKS